MGASTPVNVAFPNNTTAAQALDHLSGHLSGVDENSAVLALVPSLRLPEGRVLDKEISLNKYEDENLVVSTLFDYTFCFLHQMQILNEPMLIRVGISKKTLDNVVEVLVDGKAPLFSLIPILSNVFKIEDEFSFLYVEASETARWLSLNKGLLEQSIAPTSDSNKGLLLLYP